MMQTNKYPQDLVLEGYGVKLKRLTHDKIEMLRQWRNDPKIQQYMFYRETITPEMQEKWFQKINNDHNFYFIIEYEGKEIGCNNFKDIDYVKGICEPGIFIYDDAFLNTDVSIRASLCLCDFGFCELEMRSFRGHVIRNNKRAIRFNKALGYKMLEGEEDNVLQLWELTRDAYEQNAPKFINLLKYSDIKR